MILGKYILTSDFQNYKWEKILKTKCDTIFSSLFHMLSILGVDIKETLMTNVYCVGNSKFSDFQIPSFSYPQILTFPNPQTQAAI